MHNKCINAMRMLSLQAIKLAKQGHVGMSMSASPLVYTLYTNHINIAKDEPKWFNRDRFVLSAGHGSLTIYSVLHFCGLLSLDDIKGFKTKHSKTPGHPEYENDNYVDASTGPLGQGVAMAVGMAIAEKYLSNKFINLKGLIDHYTYAVLGDGDLQEGISYESMSLAGKLKLNKLIFLHDSNDFQLDSKVECVFNEDLKKRMESMNWNYIKVSNHFDSINKAIDNAKQSNKPTFIEVKTIIGEGSNKQNSNKSHSMSLKDEDIVNADKYFKTNHNDFNFDQSIYDYFNNTVIKRGTEEYKKWKNLGKEYAQKFPKEYSTFQKWINNDFGNLKDVILKTQISQQNVATRNYVKDILNYFKESQFDWLISGCADLEAATNIKIGNNNFNSDYTSNNILYGIREFAMSAITNGILLHSGLKTISGSFLVFSDYMKSSIRLGALMQLPNMYIFTHDSYQVGGDGPTHQPVDQLAMLRSIPNVLVHKPCDEKELMAAFDIALNSKNITNIIILTRHALDSTHNSSYLKTKKGGYIIDDQKDADIVLAGCGSEIDLLFEVKKSLLKQNIKAKIVSIPCVQTLLTKKESYLLELFKSKKGLLTIEASSDSTWYKLYKYANNFYHFEAKEFGLSMDGDKLYKMKGFNEKNLISIIKKNLLN